MSSQLNANEAARGSGEAPRGRVLVADDHPVNRAANPPARHLGLRSPRWWRTGAGAARLAGAGFALLTDCHAGDGWLCIGTLLCESLVTRRPS